MTLVRLVAVSLVTAVGAFFVTVWLLGSPTTEAETFAFDGTSDVRKSFAKLAPPYTIGATFRTTDAVVPGKFGKTYPPMPFSAGPLVVYHVGNTFKFNVDGGKLEAEAKVNQAWTNVLLRVLGDGQAELFVNNAKVWSGAVRNKNLKKVWVGNGFAQRFWTGEFADFYIVSALLAPGSSKVGKVHFRNKSSVIFQLF